MRLLSTLLVSILLLTLSPLARAADGDTTPRASSGLRGLPNAPPPRGPTRVVHLHGKDIWIEQSTGDQWAVACVAPCDVPLETFGTYRVNGPSVGATKPFQLLAVGEGERVVIEASDADDNRVGGGVALVALGGAGALVGLLLKIAEGIAQDEHSVTGTAVLVASGVALAGGIALITTGFHPYLEQTRAPARAARTARDQAVRAPTWSSPAPLAPRGAALGMPLLRVSF